MASITGHIKTIYNTASAHAVGDFFAAAALPVPHEDEYFISTDSGLLVFLKDEACVLRFVSESHPAAINCTGQRAIHPEILQPIGIRALNDRVTLELVPGIKVGLNASTYIEVFNRLKDAGFTLNDFPHLAFRNGGRLPDGTPVILDRGAVLDLHNTARDIKRGLGAQDRIFGPLSEAFATAWPEQAALPEKDALAPFWAQCRNMKKTGFLVDGWNEIKHESRQIAQIQKIARTYHDRRTGKHL